MIFVYVTCQFKWLKMIDKWADCVRFKFFISDALKGIQMESNQNDIHNQESFLSL